MFNRNPILKKYSHCSKTIFYCSKAISYNCDKDLVKSVSALGNVQTNDAFLFFSIVQSTVPKERGENKTYTTTETKGTEDHQPKTTHIRNLQAKGFTLRCVVYS